MPLGLALRVGGRDAVELREGASCCVAVALAEGLRVRDVLPVGLRVGVLLDVRDRERDAVADLEAEGFTTAAAATPVSWRCFESAGGSYTAVPMSCSA